MQALPFCIRLSSYIVNDSYTTMTSASSCQNDVLELHKTSSLDRAFWISLKQVNAGALTTNDGNEYCKLTSVLVKYFLGAFFATCTYYRKKLVFTDTHTPVSMTGLRLSRMFEFWAISGFTSIFFTLFSDLTFLCSLQVTHYQYFVLSVTDNTTLRLVFACFFETC